MVLTAVVTFALFNMVAAGWSWLAIDTIDRLCNKGKYAYDVTVPSQPACALPEDP